MPTQRVDERTPGGEATEAADLSEMEISEKSPSWPVSSREASPMESPTKEHPSPVELPAKEHLSPVESPAKEHPSAVQSPTREQPSSRRMCIRCLKGWRIYVQAEEEIPECTFAKGNRRYKCNDCSQKRVPCDIVPQRIIAKMVARKQEMEELEKESRDSKESREARQRFNEAYAQTIRELRNPRRATETLKRENRRCLRERSKENTPEKP
ncbi:hypothetical protein BDV38DRAFT_288619 [Aspergillus pseudotamarii]|uniref:Uncharacterized protein n=1 Tax=Aspergillus pseudotamarii TaxID=132259 RepID=A0A5N6SCC6_ASPPS|nr:uncharacterized protein BDV38DRAFT_288619 [Aspergillus pseudotamarii]KAE8131509.1 hypothetical protein BDV38DRAFT_288619 [Aspergillus pseudotamarii]